MTDSRVPPGGSNDDDDLDALLEGLGFDEPAESAPAAPRKPLYAPPPPPLPKPPVRDNDVDRALDMFSDDEDTRMVSLESLRQSAETPGAPDAKRAGAGLGEMFRDDNRPTAPPPSTGDVLTDLPHDALIIPGSPRNADEPSFADLALDDQEIARRARQQTVGMPALPRPKQVAPPLPRTSATRPHGTVTPSIENPPWDDPSDDAEVSLETSDEDDEAELTVGEEDGPALETSDDAPDVETADEDDDDGVDLQVGDDDAEVELSVGDEPDAPQDRGALLAATVTSRQRFTEALDVLGAGEPREEAEARAAMLEAEAEHQPPARAAELLCMAGELASGALSDAARAIALYERAYELDPKSVFALRALRRAVLEAGDASRAADLADEELALALADDEREALESFAAEIAARDGAAPAESRWESIGKSQTARGALARLFLGGSRHDRGIMGDALGALGQTASGPLSGAASLARGRLAEGAAEAEAAFSAVHSAVEHDPSNVGAWLAMARLAVGSENAQHFREAMHGIARAAQDSAAEWAAVAMDRATGAVLSDALEPVAIATGGVGAWLVAHALRDAGLDDAPQIEAALKAANDVQRARWSVLTGGDDDATGSEVGRLLALRRAVSTDDAPRLARAAGALLGDDDAARAAVEAAVLAHKGAFAAGEVTALANGSMPRHGAALLAATRGIDAAEAGRPVGDEASGSSRVAHVLVGMQSGTDVAAARSAFDEIAASDGAAIASRVFAVRQSARLAGNADALEEAVAREAGLATEPRRIAALRSLGSALAARREGAPGIAQQALEAARALPGDLGAAELVALFAMRDELTAADAADVLAAAAGDASTVAWRMAAVRAALRRAATDPDKAADALYDVWSHARQDGPLAALTLRALPIDDATRRVTVLQDIAERAQTASPAAGLASWTLVAHALEDANRPAEAAHALARARTYAKDDAALMAWEEKLWLRAGMLSEVAERSFDALKAATDDEARIAAYERLAELDSAFREDVASAVLTYQAILELAPGHMASLRTLERYFLEHGRYDDLLGVYDKLIRHVGDPVDALGIAHAAARIAIKQADGDTGAGTPFWTAAFERGVADVRLVIALDGESRRAGETRRFADVMLKGESLVRDPLEQATFATRAGEALLLLGDSSGAAAAFERALAARPNHPVALTWLAEAREVAGEPAAAAEAHETYARSTRVASQAVGAYHRAGVLWQDKANAPERARLALREVLTREPSHPDAFVRARRVLSSLGDARAELEVLETRIASGGEPEELLPLHVRAAELAGQLQDPARAQTALRAALLIEPERQDALRELARLAREAEDWALAADSMIKLARLTQDNAERIELMFGLGDIFDTHLVDLRRAEAAWRRVMQLQPGDLRTLQRLAALYARTDNGQAEVEALNQLIEASVPGVPRRELSIRVAGVLNEKLNEPAKAEEILEAARREAPTDMDVLRAFARLYMRTNQPQQLVVLLDRAAAEVRRQLDAAITSTVLLSQLADILKLRGRVDGARVVGAVAYSLGVANEKLEQIARQGAVPGAGPNALSAEVLELLAPPSVSNGHRELFRVAADVVEKLLPFEPGAMRAEKLGSRAHPLRAEIERWAKIFGLESIEIYLGPATTLVVTPLSRHPAAVLVPASLQDGPLARFAIVRAMALVALSLPLVVRLPARDLTLLMSALLRQFEPMFSVEGVDIARLDDLARRITRVLQRPKHGEMAPSALEIIRARGTDGEAIAAGAIELANRIAVLASGNVIDAVHALTPPGEEPKSAVNSVPALGRLVRVALSDRFVEARHVTGADRSTSGA